MVLQLSPVQPIANTSRVDSMITREESSYTTVIRFRPASGVETCNTHLTPVFQGNTLDYLLLVFFFLVAASPALPPVDSARDSIHDTLATSAPSSSNLRLNLPSLPVVAPSSSTARSSDQTPVFQIGLLVVSRVRRNVDRGDVVQCVNEVPSERMTR
jgi:hypothetical protein